MGNWFKDRKQETIARNRREGIVTFMWAGQRLQVATPHRLDFTQEALQLGGRYRQRTGIWTFRAYQEPLVIAAIHRVYGPDTVIARARRYPPRPTR